MTAITTGLALLGALSCMYFVAAFWWTTGGDWWHNSGGRHVMQFTANLGALFVLIVAARIWGSYPGRPVITLVLFAALVVQLIWRCVLLHKAQANADARD